MWLCLGVGWLWSPHWQISRDSQERERSQVAPRQLRQLWYTGWAALTGQEPAGGTKKPKCKPRVLHTQSQASQRPYTSYTDTQQLSTASTRTLLSVRVEHHPGTRTTCWPTCRGSPRQGEYWPSLERGMWRTFRPSQWDMRSLSTDCAEENCLHVLRDSIGTSWLYLFYVYKLLNSKNAWKYSPGPNKLLIV